MRVWFHCLLAVCVACLGMAMPTRGCAQGTDTTGAAAHDHCGGQAEHPPSEPVAPVADVDVANGSDTCLDCCGSGQCGCPCATLAALPALSCSAAPSLPPQGPPIAGVTSLVPKATAPPLRPPIS